MTDLDCSADMLGGGMYRYYFNSGNRTDLYIYCEYTKNFDYTLTIEKENECAHKNLKEERTEATCSKEGKIIYTWADCGHKETRTLKKLTATGTLNATSFPLKVKQSAPLKVSNLAAGDKIVSWTSSNTKIATVSAKGKVTGKKKDTAKITATLASGLRLTAKVTVQTKTVKTTKVTVNKKNVTLTK